MLLCYASLQEEINVINVHRNEEQLDQEHKEGKCWLYFVQLITQAYICMAIASGRAGRVLA